MTDYILNDSIVTSNDGEHARSLVSGDTVVVNAGISVTANGANASGIFLDGNPASISLLSNAHVASTKFIGIKVGGGSQIRIGADASVFGKVVGIEATPPGGDPNSGGASYLWNSGDISGTIGARFGYSTRSVSDFITNTGSIVGTSGTGLQISGAGTVINSGRIEGLIGIVGDAAGGLARSISNSGLIVGHARTAITVTGADAPATVVNTGHIEGSINFSSMTGLTGNLYDGRGGTISGQIRFSLGNDRAYGGAGNETIIGGPGDDTIDGGGGNDVVQFTGGSNLFTWTTANGVTTVEGEGTDTLTNVRFMKFSDRTVALINAAPDGVKLSTEAVAETALVNTAVATHSAHDADGDALTYTLNDPSGTFRLDGTSLILAKALDYETGQRQFVVTLTAKDAYGLSATQSLTLGITNMVEVNPLTPTGTAAADALIGEAGNDKIYGLGGNDALKGEVGNDMLYGGLGKDMLTGGTGKDVFVFDTRPNKSSNLDTITDFSVADDTIWLDNKYMSKLGKGSPSKPVKLAAKAFYAGTKAHDGDDRIVYNKKTGALFYDDDGTGAHAAIQIATLPKNLKMTAADFFVF